VATTSPAGYAAFEIVMWSGSTKNSWRAGGIQEPTAGHST